LAQRVAGYRMYLDQISEFIEFISVPELSMDEIYGHLVLVVLAPLSAEALTLDCLNSKNQFENIGRWGMPPEMIKDYVDVYNFTDRYPSTDALRYRKTTYVNTLPDWGDEYPLLKDLPYTTGAKSFIAFPIERLETPVAALGIYCREVIQPNNEIETFLRAVGGVLSMYMFNRSDKKCGSTQKSSPTTGLTQPLIHNLFKKLTERQQVILRLMGEDRTNLDIGEMLGYSESTIRQESMRIFETLECHGRVEAAKIYREMLATPDA
jgi:DNA-binding CsgD family transcriptional regulator